VKRSIGFDVTEVDCPGCGAVLLCRAELLAISVTSAILAALWEAGHDVLGT